MADATVPHFANDGGIDKIRIGAREFMCVGARPPYDHPHVYLDMGADDEKLCPWCGTLYVHDSALKASESVPAEAAWHPTPAIAAE